MRLNLLFVKVLCGVAELQFGCGEELELWWGMQERERMEMR